MYLNTSRTKSISCVLPLLTLLAGTPAAVRADDTDALNFEVSQVFQYDSNLYRLPDGFVAPRDKRHDTVSVTTAALVFDRTYSRQRLRGSLAVNSSRYAVHDDLDYDSPAAQVAWNWQLGNHWSGVMDYRYSETLGGFEEYGSADRSINKYSRGSVGADYWLHPDWALGAGAGKTQSRYESGVSIGDENDTTTYDFNLKYRPKSGNQVLVTFRNTDGRYPNRPDVTGALREYNQREVRINADWRPTGALRVSGYVGETRRSYEHADNRGFEGLTGRVAVDWMPTGKLAINLAWRRELGAEEDVFANYAVTQAYSFAPTWQVTSKLVAGLNWERRQRDYGGDPRLVPDFILRPDRDEITHRYGLNLGYQFAPDIFVSMSYAHQKRDGAISSRRYSADTFLVSGSLRF